MMEPNAEMTTREVSAENWRLRRNKAREMLSSWAKWIPAMLLLIVWEAGSGVFIDKVFFSSPSAILGRLIDDFRTGRILVHAYTTAVEIFGGYAIGVTLGTIVGYFSGRSRRVAAFVEPYALLVNAIPKVAIAPVIIMWFGIGMQGKFVMAAMMVFFVVFFNVFLGVRSINPEFIYLASIMGANRFKIILHVVLPYITPFFLTGLKQGIVSAVIGTLIAEFIASSRGLGYYILLSSGNFDITSVFVGVLVLMSLVVTVNALLNAIENHYVRWGRYR
jgi:NitT/TauT family transport system permease protein